MSETTTRHEQLREELETAMKENDSPGNLYAIARKAITALKSAECPADGLTRATDVEVDTRLLQSRPAGVCPKHGPDTIDPGPLELLRSLSSINSQKEVAATYEISPQYLSDILNGRREISAVLAARIGYQRVVTFVKKA